MMRSRTAPENPTVVRLPFLEGLRGLAALYVVLGHICSMADPSKLAGRQTDTPVWLQQVMAPFQYGHLAVASFIVLSGFCLQLALFSNADGTTGPLGAWFKRRAKRILPAYYGALALSVWVGTTITAKQSGYPFALYLPITPENVAAHVFLVHNLSLDWMYKINGVMWSIAIEAQLYLLFPFLVQSVFKVGRWGTMLLAVVAAVIVLALVPTAMKLYPWYLPLFVAGMISAHVAYRPNLKTGTRPWLAAFITAVALCVAGYASTLDAPLVASDAAIGVAIAALCYLMTVTEAGIICRTLSWGPIVSLGSFSYSLYLIHHPIEQIVYAHRPEGIAGAEAMFWFLLGVGLPIILIASWAFSLVFERPFLTRKAPKPEVIDLGMVPLSLPLIPFDGSAGSPVEPAR